MSETLLIKTEKCGSSFLQMEEALKNLRKQKNTTKLVFYYRLLKKDYAGQKVIHKHRVSKGLHAHQTKMQLRNMSNLKEKKLGRFLSSVFHPTEVHPLEGRTRGEGS